MSIPTNLIPTLSAPLSSTDQLLRLLVPILALAGQLEDRNDLILAYSTNLEAVGGGTKTLSSFYKRSLGFLQKLILEKLWLDWFRVLEAEEVGLGEIILGRFILPIAMAERGDAVEIAISSFTVLGVLLSNKGGEAAKNPELLSLMSEKAMKLVEAYSIKEIFLHLFSPTSNGVTAAPKNELNGTEITREDQMLNGIREERWESIVRNLATLPTRLANCIGIFNEDKVKGRMDIPASLIWINYFGDLSRQFESLLWTISESEIDLTSNMTTALASPLHSLVSSSFFPSSHSSEQPSFFISTFSAIILYLLPPPFPATPAALIRRSRYSILWRSTLAELSESDQRKVVLSLLRFLEGTELVGVEFGGEARVKSTQFVLEELCGTFSSSSSDSNRTVGDNSAVTEEEVSVAWKITLPLLLKIDSPAAWSIGMARVIYNCAVKDIKSAGKGKGKVLGTLDLECGERLIELVLKVWSSLESITKESELGRTYLSILFLLMIQLLPPCSPIVIKLSRSGPFLAAVNSHLTLLRPTTRLLGMLVAEMVSARTVDPKGEMKALDFGEVWNGESQDQKLIKNIRKLVSEGSAEAVTEWQEDARVRWAGLRPSAVPPPPTERTNPKSSRPAPPAAPLPQFKKPLITIINDSDDESDLKPYPLPAPPSKSYLDTLTSDDPSLYATTLPSTNNSSASRRRGKLRAPVYISELTAYLKGKVPEGGEDKPDEEAERIESGLKEGTGLIRRKAGWGGELDENSVDLAFTLMGLQDPFEIENFDTLKLDLLIALVASSPKLVAPAIIEQYFFHQYSVSQRHTMLTALALAARELSGFPPPESNSITASHSSKSTTTPIPEISLFPSKKLPLHLHRQLIEEEIGKPTLNLSKPGVLEKITEDLMNVALSETREEAESFVPQAAREKLLSVRRFPSAKSPSTELAKGKGKENYNSLAAEFFIMPLINRFWLYLRDNATSPSRTNSYVGAGGSASLLEPLILTKFLSTLSVLLHASQNSAHFLAVLAPEAIELALSMRRPVEECDEAVLSTLVELLLIVFSASVSRDRGTTLVNTNNGTRLVGEAKELAEEVFDWEERKGSIRRLGRAAAGVLLRIEEIDQRWRVDQGW